MAVCNISGLITGSLCVTPETAAHLVQLKIITPLKKLGNFKVVKDGDDRLWKELRKRAW